MTWKTSVLLGSKRETRKSIRKLQRGQIIFESKAAMQEAQPLSSLLKERSPQAGQRAGQRGITSEGNSSWDHSQGTTCDLNEPRHTAPSKTASVTPPTGPPLGRGTPQRRSPRPRRVCGEKLDGKLANIDYLRKKMSSRRQRRRPLLCAQAQGDGQCPGVPAWEPGAGRLGRQQEAPPPRAAHRSSAVPPQLSSAPSPLSLSRPFLAGWTVEQRSQAWLPQRSPVRKSPSEYKLEGRSVSCLKPIEGTLDIALCRDLRPPRQSCLPRSLPRAPAQAVMRVPVPLALPNSAGRKADTAGQRESSLPASKVNKSLSA